MSDNNVENTSPEDLFDETEDDPTVETVDNEVWTPPTKADWDAVNKALKAARNDAKVARKANPAKPVEGDSAPVIDPSEVEERAAAKWKPVVVKQAAVAEFVGAGVKESAVERALKLIDMDDVTVEDDGSVTGLAEQIAALRTDLPELFTAKRAPRTDVSDRNAAPKTQKTSAQILAERLVG